MCGVLCVCVRVCVICVCGVYVVCVRVWCVVCIVCVRVCDVCGMRACARVRALCVDTRT
jgi:hypothetical protein